MAGGALACAAGPGWPDPLDAAVPRARGEQRDRRARADPDRGAAASAMMSAMDPAAYDEFSLFQENASEFGLPWPGPPSVRREDVALTGGGTLERARSGAPTSGADRSSSSSHGTAMNAHTWDTVALALDRPLVAFDLPGHGHSSWREDSTYSPDNLAEAVARGRRAAGPAGRRRWSACRSGG